MNKGFEVRIYPTKEQQILILNRHPSFCENQEELWCRFRIKRFLYLE